MQYNINSSKSLINQARTLMLNVGVMCLVGIFGYGNTCWADSPLDELAVQDKGRVKPLQSFAQETLQLIHGKKTISNQVPPPSTSEKNPEHYKKIKREASES